MVSNSCADAGLPIAEALNRNCRCLIVDEPTLARGLSAALSAEPGMQIPAPPAALFSATAVFLAPDDVAELRRLISAIEELVALPAFQRKALTWADPIAHLNPGPHGACMGYDFHLAASGPKLIEINTNAGGELLNAVLARAAKTCCKETAAMAVGCADAARLDETIVEMFRGEWHAQRGDLPLKTVGIVDDMPESQFLQLEFRLFQELFERHGLRALVVDAAAMVIRDGSLYCGDVRIDLIYNRLTDFALNASHHVAIRKAYANGTVVLTPNPHVYALYADKRNLTLLSDHEFLESLQLSASSIAALKNGVPQTLLVTPDNASLFWTQRRQWFFKPAMGFGGRAAYRGDKLTKSVFENIARGGYVAQSRVDPAKRAHPDADTAALKYDLRCYVYRGDIQLIAARLYQGQTTNFRTAGGGFAPVFYALPDA